MRGVKESDLQKDLQGVTPYVNSIVAVDGDSSLNKVKSFVPSSSRRAAVSAFYEEHFHFVRRRRFLNSYLMRNPFPVFPYIDDNPKVIDMIIRSELLSVSDVSDIDIHDLRGHYYLSKIVHRQIDGGDAFHFWSYYMSLPYEDPDPPHDVTEDGDVESNPGPPLPSHQRARFSRMSYEITILHRCRVCAASEMGLYAPVLINRIAVMDGIRDFTGFPSNRPLFMLPHHGSTLICDLDRVPRRDVDEDSIPDLDFVPVDESVVNLNPTGWNDDFLPPMSADWDLTIRSNLSALVHNTMTDLTAAYNAGNDPLITIRAVGIYWNQFVIQVGIVSDQVEPGSSLDQLVDFYRTYVRNHVDGILRVCYGNVEYVPAAPLVGIEENPGPPTWQAIALEVFVVSMFEVGCYFTGQAIGQLVIAPTYHFVEDLAIEVSNFLHTSIDDLFTNDDILEYHSSLVLKRDCEEAKKLITFMAAYSAMDPEDTPPAPRLVGIESNPGPTVLSKEVGALFKELKAVRKQLSLIETKIVALNRQQNKPPTHSSLRASKRALTPPPSPISTFRGPEGEFLMESFAVQKLYTDAVKYGVEIDPIIKELVENLDMEPEVGDDDDSGWFGGAKRFVRSSIPSTVPVTVEIQPGTQEWMSDIMSRLEGAMSKGIELKHSMPLVDSFLEPFMNKDSMNSRTTKVMALVIIVGLSILSSKMDIGPFGRGLISIVQLAVSVYCVDSVLSAAIVTVLTAIPHFTGQKVNSEDFNPDPKLHQEVDPEVGFDLKSDSINVVLGYIFYTVFGQVAASDHPFDSFLKGVSGIDRTKRSLDTTVEWLISVCGKFVNWLGELSDNALMKEFNVTFPEITTLTKEFNDVIAILRDGGSYNRDNADVLFSIESRARKLLVSIPGGRENEVHKRSCESLLRCMTPYLDAFQQHNVVNNGPRVPTFCVAIHGSPGVGKTACQHKFIGALGMMVMSMPHAAMYLNKRDDAVFNWPYGFEFDGDGYHGQELILADDFGQVRDSGTQDKQAYSFIRMANTNQCGMNCSTLQFKGTIFRGLVLVATTNVWNWNFPSIVSMEAFNRRWNVEVILVPSVEHCTPASLKCAEGFSHTEKLKARRLDKTTTKLVINPETGDEEADIDVWEFYLMSGATGEVTGRKFTFHELVEYSEQLYFKEKAISEALLAQDMTVANKYYQIRLDRERAKLVPQVGEDVPIVDNLVVDYVYERDLEWFVRVTARELGLSEKLMRQTFNKYRIDETFTVLEVYHHYAIMYFGSWYETTHEMCGRIGDFVRSRPILTALAASIGVLACAWVWMKPSFELVEQSGETKHRSKKTMPKKRSKALIKTTAATTLLEPQACELNQNLKDMAEVIYHTNTYRISVPGKNAQIGFMTFVRNRVALGCTHFFDTFKRYEDELCQCVTDGPIESQCPEDCSLNHRLMIGDKWNPRCSYTMEGALNPAGCREPVPILFERIGAKACRFLVNYRDLDIIRAKTSDSQDQAFCRIPEFVSDCPRHRDIVNYFVAADCKGLSRNFVGAQLQVDIEKHDDGSVTTGTYHLVTGPVTNIGAHEYGGYHTSRIYAHCIIGYKGLCGAPMFVADSEIHLPKICGMHAAGNEDKTIAMAIPVTKTDVEDVLAFFKETPTDYLLLKEGSKVVKLESGLPLQHLALEERPLVHQNYNTTIERTEFYGLFGEATKVPCNMRAHIPPRSLTGLPVDPYFDCRDRYGRMMPLLEYERLHAATDSYISECVRATHNPFMTNDPSILDFEESIKGRGLFKGIKMSASTGYDLHFPTTKKSDVFGDPTLPSMMTRPAVLKLQDWYMKDMEMLYSGLRPDWINNDFMKDETLPIEKVLVKGKVRLVSGCCLRELLAVRSLFGDWEDFMMENPVVSGTAIGINVYGPGWTLLVEYLAANGPDALNRLIAGDHGMWDARFRNQLMHFVLLVVEAHYWNSTPAERLARRTCIDIMGNSRHAVHGLKNIAGKVVTVIIEMVNSIGSGHPATAQFNSVGNCIITRYAISLVQTKVIGTVDFLVIENNLRFVGFGDDNVMSIGEGMLYVTQRELTEAFALMGMDYTDESKSAVQHDFRCISEISFLQRMFLWNKSVGMYLAPLKIDSIIQSLYWKSKKCSRVDFCQTVRKAILELSLHGPDTFERYAPTIIREAYHLLHFHIIENRYRVALNAAMAIDSYEY